MFGVGSAFATPLLAAVGVSPLAAVTAPLAGLLPGSLAGAWSHARADEVDWTLVRRTALGALPAACVGAGLSGVVGGEPLLVGSGIVLLGVGWRVLRAGPTPEVAVDGSASWPVVPIAVVIGLASGLLANGGGFLLVPFYLVLLGRDPRVATGTSLAVAAGICVPTLAIHGAIGGIDWATSGWFALGVVPGAAVGGPLAEFVAPQRLRQALGVLMIGFSLWFSAGVLGG